MEITWVKSEIEGRVGVKTPFNRKFVDELKQTTPSAVFNRHKEVWFFDEEAKPDVIPLLEKFYVNVHWFRVEWDLNGSEDGPMIDGVHLMSVYRDYWKWRSPFPLKVVESDVQTGGSRNHPHISGRLVVNILMRPDAILDPPPESVAELHEDDLKRPNPLAAYSSDDLAAELERRGYEIGAASVVAVDILNSLVTAVGQQDRTAISEIYKQLEQMAQAKKQKADA